MIQGLLGGSITAQVRALSPDEQTAPFARLDREKQADTLHAGLVFRRAAKQAIVDPESPPLAKSERLRLDRELLDVPVPEIANIANAHRGAAQTAR